MDIHFNTAVGTCMTFPVACTWIQIKGTFNTKIYSKFGYQIGLKSNLMFKPKHLDLNFGNSGI